MVVVHFLYGCAEVVVVRGELLQVLGLVLILLANVAHVGVYNALRLLNLF